MRRAVILGGDDFLIAAMRFALRLAPSVQALGLLERAGAVTDALHEARPDIVLMEASDEREKAFARLDEVREACPRALVVVVAAQLDVELFHEAARRGVIACLGALPGQLAELSPDGEAPAAGGVPRLEVVEPECPLTARELEVLRSVAEGHTNAQIGRELWLTEQTVKFHLSKIYRKLGVSNRTEASRYALLRGLHVGQHSTRRRIVPQRGRFAGPVESHNGHRLLSGAMR